MRSTMGKEIVELAEHAFALGRLQPQPRQVGDAGDVLRGQ